MFWFHAISLRDGSMADGVHLLWAPPVAAGYSELGWEVWRRPARQAPQVESHALTSTQLSTLHLVMSLELPIATVSVRAGALPQAGTLEVPDEPLDPEDRDKSTPPPLPGRPWTPRISASVRSRNVGTLWAQPAPVLRSKPAAVASPGRAVVYSLELLGGSAGLGRARRVRVEVGAQTVLGIGLREGKAVIAIPPIVTTSGVAVFNFDAAPVDRVIIYALSPAKSLKLSPECVGEATFDGRDATLLASGIQLPFASFDPTLVDLVDERARAKSRLLPGERLDSEAFERLSRWMNAAGESKDRFSPVHVSSFSRARVDDPLVERPVFGHGLGLTVDPGWRRALGFGYLDEGSGLTPGGFYDYRLVGWFFRRDLEERTLGFHTLPLGITLPKRIDLGGIGLESASPLTIASPSATASNELEWIARKGVALSGRLTLHLPEPIVRLILEFEPVEAHALQFRAHGGELLSSDAVFRGPVAREARVELEFAAPVDRVELIGEAFLYAIRSSSIGAGEDPEQLIRVVQDVYGIRYEPTRAPSPPSVLGTVNLHEFTEAAPRAPSALGFRLRWLPPSPPKSIDPGLWPTDLAASWPFDALRFRLERRRVDTGGSFELVDASELQAPTAAEPLHRGDELLDRYPEHPRLEPPVSVLMGFDHVLSGPELAESEPGSLHQYRICSVDLLGRRSTPTFGSIVRLEKRVPPPKPAGPLGVHVRVLQAGSKLSANDRALLAGHDSAIVLRWGWTEAQRQADPYARSFRVYCMGEGVVLSADADELRPADWDERCAVIPIASAEAYEHVLFDRLHPSAEQPRPEVWVGVSAADDQPYIADARRHGAFGGRPGNESAVVRVAARWA